MNSNDVNKIAGAGIGALLVFLLLGFFSNQIFGSSGADHHGEEQTLAFALEVEEPETQVAEAEEAAEDEPQVNLAGLVAEADAGAGAQVFNKCRGCHQIGSERNGVGPHLNNVLGRNIASLEDYSYSDALSSKEGPWQLENMLTWLENPGNFAPGNKMGYQLPDLEERIDVIAYINQESSDPADLQSLLPEEAAAEEDRAAADEATEEAAAGDAAEGEAAEDAAQDAAEDGASQTEMAGEAAGEATAEETATEETATEETATEEAGESGTEMAAATPEAAEESGGKYASLLADASAEAGKRVYNKCRACHVADKEQNRVGPHLYGVVGREIAAVDGYSYSDALAGKDGVWNLENLMVWLENPGEFAAGNKMGYQLKDAQERIDVITYLNEVDGSPEPLN